MQRDLDALALQLAQYHLGVQSRAGLRDWFVPYVVALPVGEAADDESFDPHQDARSLFWSVFNLFHDESYSAEEHQILAGSVARLLDLHLSPDATIDILPLIAKQAPLCQIIRKYRTGIVSRMGFESFARKNFQHERASAWLAQAGSTDLEALCDLLSTHDYRGINTLLWRESA